MRDAKGAIAVFAGLLLGGCAAPAGLVPGASEAEVIAAMGSPALVLPDPDGSRVLAYPTGPYGLQTYLARISPGGRLASFEQALDDSRFDRIQPGMTREELLRLLGPPHETMRFDNLRQTAWDYRYRDTWGYLAILSVMLDDRGRVVSRITQRVERDWNRFF